MVLVFGPNESGKSSFRSALETLLYGFEPAARDAHPLYLFDPSAGDLSLEAELALRCRRMHRGRARAAASGKLRRAEGAEFAGPKLGNLALPFVADLPRALFRAVYSLELEQLAALDDGVRVHIDDLLCPQARRFRCVRPAQFCASCARRTSSSGGPTGARPHARSS